MSILVRMVERSDGGWLLEVAPVPCKRLRDAMLLKERFARAIETITKEPVEIGHSIEG